MLSVKLFIVIPTSLEMTENKADSKEISLIEVAKIGANHQSDKADSFRICFFFDQLNHDLLF